jgi:hypothetical protein
LGISGTGRSEVVVMGLWVENDSYLKFKVCEMLQLDTRTNSLDYELGRQLLKSYEKQIALLPRNVRNSFTLDNIAIGFASFRRLSEMINNYTTKTKSLKLPLYQHLTNPCFLFVVCSEIKKNRIRGIRDVSYDSMSLITLAFLASVFNDKNYLPKPIKRIFILKSTGKMRPFGAASLPDSIVQQVLQFVLTPRFELVFSRFSYGCRSKRNSHSALKHIHNS